MGLQSPADVARRMRNPQEPQGLQASGDALGDSALANNLRQQAAKMSAEAKGLMAEADRLLKEAAQMDPVKAVAETAAPKAKLAYNKKAKVSA